MDSSSRISISRCEGRFNLDRRFLISIFQSTMVCSDSHSKLHYSSHIWISHTYGTRGEGRNFGECISFLTEFGLFQAFEHFVYRKIRRDFSGASTPVLAPEASKRFHPNKAWREEPAHVSSQT